ncbi:MAG: pilus assembly protein PilM [Phycisphaerales bacterium]|nr:MAG: pilus assembly protein PilM [Phycisphaerales bacterium]
MSDRVRQKKKILSIDWDGRSLRVVHAYLGKRGVKIDRLLSVAMPSNLDPANPEQMGLHVRRTLDQEGIATRHAIVDIPRDQAILKTLTLPIAQPDELPGMVEIQIAKELPFPAMQSVIDFAVGPAADDAPTGEVLVGAIRRELLEQYEAIFAAAGLKLDRIGLRPYANKVAVCQLLRHAIPDRVLFIDVRPTFMEIDVLRQSGLSFSRSASVTIPSGIDESRVLSIGGRETPATADAGEGRVDDTQASSGLKGIVHSLVLEVTRSIEAYRVGDHGATIDHVVIGGDVGVEEALAEAIQKRLNITTEIYNPASTFGWKADEGAGASAFAASLGLVLGHAQDGSLHFDFLHPKRVVSATQQRLKKAPIAAAVVFLFAAAAAVGFAGYTKDDRQTLARLEQDIRTLEGRRSDNKKFLDVMEQIREFDANQHVWIDVMYDVFSLLPDNEEMLINRAEMNQKEGRITLKTRVKHRETPTEVIQALENFRREGRDKPRFKVTIGGQTEKKRERYPFSQDFRIEIRDDEPGKKRSSGKSSRG